MEKENRTDVDRAVLLDDLSQAFNTALRVRLLNDGRYIGLVLADETVQQMARFPYAFGLANVSQGACRSNVSAQSCSSDTPARRRRDLHLAVGNGHAADPERAVTHRPDRDPAGAQQPVLKRRPEALEAWQPAAAVFAEHVQRSQHAVRAPDQEAARHGADDAAVGAVVAVVAQHEVMALGDEGLGPVARGTGLHQPLHGVRAAPGALCSWVPMASTTTPGASSSPCRCSGVPGRLAIDPQHPVAQG